MKVAVWGAGEVGRLLAYRLASESFVSELCWINRDRTKASGYAMDITHGLAFAPTCHTVEAYGEDRAGAVIPRCDVVVLTHGGGVPAGGNRADLYESNASIIREKSIPALREFKGVVIVVTNPVDLISLLVYREAEIEHSRVIGLGTLVETSRARVAIAGYLSPQRPGRDLQVFGVGTHDEHFVLCVPEDLGLDAEHTRVVECVRAEVVRAASRVKNKVKATAFPIVEGVLTLLRAVALDSRALLTVSTLDRDGGELFLSVPCIVGSEGVVSTHPELIPPAARDQLQSCRDALRKVLDG